MSGLEIKNYQWEDDGVNGSIGLECKMIMSLVRVYYCIFLILLFGKVFYVINERLLYNISRREIFNY